MQAILDSIASIGNAITTAFQWLLHLIQEVVEITSLVGKFVLSIPGYFSFLPAPAIAIIVSIFGVVALYKLMGREG